MISLRPDVYPPDAPRLCKAKRFRYKNNDMEDLEARLKEADEAGARVKLIATDGVFSMDGIICNLKGVCDLADKYNALVMVDDSHAVGFVTWMCSRNNIKSVVHQFFPIICRHFLQMIPERRALI